MTGEKVGIGILGCSDIARRKFIPALAQANNAFLRTIASRDPDKAAASCPGLAAEPVGYEELLADPGIDLIYISLPNHLHELFVLRALREGKHVICEKPLGLSAASVERMTACAEERGMLLFENIMYLHHPQHLMVKEMAARGEIGRLRELRSVFHIPFPAAGNFRLDPLRGGGAFHDQARYAISSAWYFLAGECCSFRGHALDQNGLNISLDGTAVTTVGEIFSYSVAFGRSYACSYELVGEKGRIRVERAYTTPPDLANRIQATIDGKDASFVVPAADHFRLMIEEACAMIIDGRNFAGIHRRNVQLAHMAERLKEGCHHEKIGQ